MNQFNEQFYESFDKNDNLLELLKLCKSPRIKIDIETNEIQVINNIDQLNKYIETNKFDLIKVTQDIEQGIMASDADIAQVFATSSNAKIVAQFVHVWADGCIGTHTFHSALFGLFQWDTYERIVCPNGVTP